MSVWEERASTVKTPYKKTTNNDLVLMLCVRILVGQLVRYRFFGSLLILHFLRECDHSGGLLAQGRVCGLSLSRELGMVLRDCALTYV